MDDNVEKFSSNMDNPIETDVAFSSYNSVVDNIRELCSLYIFRPEMMLCGAASLVFLFIYLLAVYYRRLCELVKAIACGRITSPVITETPKEWMEVRQQSAAFAILGRRPRMEDRFVIEENIDNTGISFFAVFDGHGGAFAADFAKNILVQSIFNTIIEMSEFLESNSKQVLENATNSKAKMRKIKRKTNLQNNKNNDQLAGLGQSNSFRKICTTVFEHIYSVANMFTAKPQKETPKLHSPTTGLKAKYYIKNGNINFSQILMDKIVAVDRELINVARVTETTAGTTALIAIIQNSQLFVANVGDSRGVMCNSRGLAIPLSHDHKPEYDPEWDRILKAGGYITFKGVWRVAGILAMSRAMGDYPLKDRNMLVPTPDIFKFDLKTIKPKFIILATDGLWDKISNQAACNFISKHITEADFGAKSLVLESYRRGSKDNITVLIVVFKKDQYYISSLPKFVAT